MSDYIGFLQLQKSRKVILGTAKRNLIFKSKFIKSKIQKVIIYFKI